MMEKSIETGLSAIDEITKISKRLGDVTDTLVAQTKDLQPLKEANQLLEKQLSEVTAIHESLIRRMQEHEARIERSEKAFEILLDKSMEQLREQIGSLMQRSIKEIQSEMRDTRESIRDRVDTNIQRLTQEVHDMEERIKSEMPRSLLGKRGK